MLGRRDSVAGIMTGHGLNGPGFNLRRGQNISIFSPPTIETESRAHPSHCSLGTEVISRWIKRQIRDSNTSPPSAQFKNELRYTLTLPMRLRGVAKDNFTFSSVLVFAFANGSNISYDMAKMDGH